MEGVITYDKTSFSVKNYKNEAEFKKAVEGRFGRKVTIELVKKFKELKKGSKNDGKGVRTKHKGHAKDQKDGDSGVQVDKG